jgi:N-acetylglutamate synthase-like GNAT family acetyltransferase
MMPPQSDHPRRTEHASIQSTTKRRFEIIPLADCPDEIPRLAAWVFSEWNAIEAIPVEKIAAGFTNNLNHETIPITFIARIERQPVGCVSIDLTDLPNSDHIGPWLASLYVAPDFRRSGIGAALLRHAQAFSWNLGIHPLLLWTTRNTDFFKREGWIETGQIELAGSIATLMRQGTCDPPIPPSNCMSS